MIMKYIDVFEFDFEDKGGLYEKLANKAKRTKEEEEEIEESKIDKKYADDEEIE